MAVDTTERVYNGHPYADAFKAQIAREARKRVTVALLQAAVRG